MKLLYLWIENTRNEFIKETGFNLAGEYTWKFDLNSNILVYEKKKGYIENFWGSNIDDLTVIVGANGSGKTTLLSEIIKYNIITKNENSDDKKLLSLQERKLIIYKKDNQIYYNHNLQCEINVPSFVTKGELNTLSRCTKIFVSNSIEKIVGQVGYNREGVYEYSLTDFTINSQAKQILNYNKIGTNSLYYPFYDDTNRCKLDQLNNLIHIDESAYDNLDALIKLFFLVKSSSDQYMGKRYVKVNLYVKGEKEVYDNRRTPEQVNDFNNIKNLTMISKSLSLNSLVAYFCFELSIYFGNSFFAKIDKLNLVEIEKQLIKTVKQQKFWEDKNPDIIYFKDAIKDLILFEQLIDENEIISQNSIEAYEYLQIDLKKNDVFFDRIFRYFKEQRPSFLLSYTSFRFDNSSSGEEALLKLYSRIFWLYNAQKCMKNSLVLIDEVDLYMHPKWQRNLVNCLIEDMGKLIGKENKAQIIITSHSPIFLSDIPKANVLFLVNKDKKCVVDDSDCHQDTFGNNVHTLFLDSFFLDEEGTMGAFAEKKINEILRLLHSESKINDENEKIFRIINCIGDQLIRYKLLELYEKNQQIKPQLESVKSLNNVQINNTIIMLEKQIRELQNMVAQLEQIRND